MKKAILFVGILILLIPPVIGCHKNGTMDSKAIEAEVKQALPIGTPKEKVDLYLTNHKIEHSFYKPENRIYAIVRNLQKQSFGISESLSVIFSFDATNSLTNIESKVEYTGPWTGLRGGTLFSLLVQEADVTSTMPDGTPYV